MAPRAFCATATRGEGPYEDENQLLLCTTELESPTLFLRPAIDHVSRWYSNEVGHDAGEEAVDGQPDACLEHFPLEACQLVVARCLPVAELLFQPVLLTSAFRRGIVDLDV